MSPSQPMMLAHLSASWGSFSSRVFKIYMTMNDEVIKIYRANKLYNSPLLAVPAILSALLVSDGGPIPTEKWMGFGILSAMALIVALIPFGGRLEVGNDYIKTYFLNFC